jgi:4a-hydroxytetrahydrobiopterin dehydratase
VVQPLGAVAAPGQPDGKELPFVFRGTWETFSEAQEDEMSLAEKRCVPCRGGVPALQGEELERLRVEVPEWQIINNHHTFRRFTFPDFRKALDFVNRVGEVAEEEGHHPDLYLSWGKVDIKIWTHKIDGLTESDFILAAKIDRLYQNGTEQ